MFAEIRKICYNVNKKFSKRKDNYCKKMHRKEGKMKKWTDIIEKLTMLTQLSLSLVTPLLLCLGLCWWSSNRWSVGGWIYLIGFFFGLGGSAMTAWKFYRSVVMRQERTEKEKRKSKVSFNRHL